MLSAKFDPIRLSRRAEPFDSSDFIYEIKHDGFRALASVQAGQCQLVSRNGNVFRGFKELAESIGRRLRVDAVFDGEIVALDEYGRSQFNDLLFRRGRSVLLWLRSAFFEWSRPTPTAWAEFSARSC